MGGRKQLRQDGFMPVGVLSQVGGGEVKAEYLDRANERSEPETYQGGAVVWPATKSRMVTRSARNAEASG